mmetsp:Transcript_11386/g.35135  ORF Transcript_11386/g.35135 Transcript_11386/m.35135 type:complete len:214 (+) Transcript_11386:2397-3038(+)
MTHRMRTSAASPSLAPKSKDRDGVCRENQLYAGMSIAPEEYSFCKPFVSRPTEMRTTSDKVTVFLPLSQHICLQSSLRQTIFSVTLLLVNMPSATLSKGVPRFSLSTLALIGLHGTPPSPSAGCHTVGPLAIREELELPLTKAIEANEPGGGWHCAAATGVEGTVTAAAASDSTSARTRLASSAAAVNSTVRVRASAESAREMACRRACGSRI